MRTTILNVPFDVATRDEALEKLLSFLKKDKNHILFTPNPEFVMLTKKDRDFLNIIKNADLVVPDGIGIVLASKLNKVKIKERVAGCDLILSLFDAIKDTPYTVYLFGSKPNVAEAAKKNMEARFKNLKIVGVADGYFDKNKEGIIIEEIQKLKPDILLVGLGFPKQEKWIYKYKDTLPVKISAGVGGTIDVMAGSVKRAPAIYRKLGLEWFYRLLKQPTRFVRMLQLPLFVIEVMLSKLRAQK